MKKLEDSGSRTEFETGAQRELAPNKGRFDLLPGTAIAAVMHADGNRPLNAKAMALLALHFERGAAKYSARNWEKGLPLWSFLDSGLRHAYKELAGEGDEDHAIALLWNLICYLDTDMAIAHGKAPKSLREPEVRLQTLTVEDERNPSIERADINTIIFLVHCFTGSGDHPYLYRAIRYLCTYIGNRNDAIEGVFKAGTEFSMGDRVAHSDLINGRYDDRNRERANVSRNDKNKVVGYVDPSLYVPEPRRRKNKKKDTTEG